MCTLVVSFQPADEWPLVIAANRDERVDRPATPPRLWQGPLPFISSMVLLLARDLSRTRFRWAEGPPCRTPFFEQPQLVQALWAS